MNPESAFGPTPRWASLGALLFVLVAALAFATSPLFRPHRLSADFNTFYCAGAALGRHADPYLAEPLGACERRAMTPQLVHVGPGVAMPAPLPPYALAPFVLLARVPYLWAIAIWSIVILLATWATLFAMRRLTGMTLPALVAIFGLGTLVALELGQVAPLATAGIALSAYFANLRKDRLAALAAACAMLEPHVALPACLALFLWLPRTRLTLILAGLVCSGLSLALVGPSVALEYVRYVLPGHAISEVGNHQQLSLTYVVHHFGVAAAAAVRMGEIWYAAMLVLGIAVARGFAARKPQLVPALPVAFALFGGAFVHAVQLPAALPAALILLAAAPAGKQRRFTGAGVTLLALPFIQFATLWPCSIPLYGAVAIVLVATLLRGKLLPSLACALAACAVPLALWTTVHFGGPPDPAALVSAYDPHALADVSWTRYMNLVSAQTPAQLDAVKLPLWFGLATVLAAALAGRFPGKARSARAASPAIEELSPT